MDDTGHVKAIFKSIMRYTYMYTPKVYDVFFWNKSDVYCIVLFVFWFNVPVNNFSVMSGRSHRFLGNKQYSSELMCLAQGHNNVPPVGNTVIMSAHNAYQVYMGPEQLSCEKLKSENPTTVYLHMPVEKARQPIRFLAISNTKYGKSGHT